MMSFSAHVLPLYPSQSTFWHSLSRKRLFSTVILDKFCWHWSFSIFICACLSHIFSSVLRPVHARPPHSCSFFSLERDTFETPHSSGHADHSPHSSQVQSIARCLKWKNHNGNPASSKNANILTTALFVAFRNAFHFSFQACLATISRVPFYIPWPRHYPIFPACLRAWPPVSPVVVCAVTFIFFNGHFQFHYHILLFLQLNILCMSCFVQVFNCVFQFFKTLCFIQRAQGICNSFQNI